MSSTTEQVGPRTRRERQRQATFDEIVAEARGLLRRGEKPTLRAVAGEMGMTAPALYRYVDSHHELMRLVAGSIFDDVLAALVEARDRVPQDDPAAQILVCAVAFRRWALSNREEFGLVFASSETNTSDGPPETGEGPGAAFGQFFGDIYVRLWQRYEFPVPPDDELPPAVARALAAHEGPDKLPCDFPGMPLGLSWLFMRSWARLYGTVTLEVFRHIDAVVIDSGALFAASLEDNARDCGFGDDWPRLRALMREELQRSVQAIAAVTTP